MAAPSFSFLFSCCILGVTIGSESEPPSVLGIPDNMTRLEHKVLQLEDKMSSVENSIAAIPQMLQAEIEQLLITVLDEMEIKLENFASTNKEEGEALQFRFKQSLRNQTLLIDELSRQMEDVQNSCFGEPPSPRNGRPMDFERKHGSDVRYQCDENFWVTGNSTVRCSFGKWEGQPPLCRFFDTSFILRGHYDVYQVFNVTCSSKVNNQKIQFSRDLDTGLTGDLPSGAKFYSRGKASVLDLSGVTRGGRSGVYNCGYEKDGTSTGISFRVHEDDYLVRLVVASIGDIAELGSGADNPSFRWLHDGRHVPSGDGRRNLTIPGVKVTDAGTYERILRGDRLYFRLVVRGCRSTHFGEDCDQECPPCYNGGTCHDLLGVCVCPPGFTGTNCELACGENKFGENCSESCHGEDCRWQIFCKPYPSGCSCAPGYRGYRCLSKCDKGKFGADCKQTCRCAEGSCDRYTGACPGDCSPGWTGQSCQIPA